MYSQIKYHHYLNKIVNKIKQEKSLTGIIKKFYKKLNKTFFARQTYKDWIDKYEADDTQEIAERWIKAQNNVPRFTIIVAFSDLDIHRLMQLLVSVNNQVYTNWQLILIIPPSLEGFVKEKLASQIDPANDISIIIDKNRNPYDHALQLARGDFIIPLNNNGILSAFALFHLACQIISNNHECLILYSDEDQINRKNKRHTPVFKTRWNKTLFLTMNYLHNFCAIKKNLFKKISEIQPDYQKAHITDLLLFLDNSYEEKNIIHIPRVLYHRLDDINEKRENRKELIKNYLREKYPATKTLIENSDYNYLEFIPEKWPRVTCIIPAHNKAKLTKDCIDGLIHGTDYPKLEIILVDNRSSEQDALKLFKEYEKVENIRVINWDHPFNYSEINNMAVDISTGSILALINNDVKVIRSDWLKKLTGWANLPQVGAVGPKLLYADGSIQHAGVVCGMGELAGHMGEGLKSDTSLYNNFFQLQRQVSAVTGACLVVKKSVYKEVGGLDEKNFPVAFNDIDFCLKLHSYGYQNIYIGDVELYHLESQTRDSDTAPENIERYNSEKKVFKTRWQPFTKGDPFFPPHYSLEKSWPALLNKNEEPHYFENNLYARHK